MESYRYVKGIGNFAHEWMDRGGAHILLRKDIQDIEDELGHLLLYAVPVPPEGERCLFPCAGTATPSNKIYIADDRRVFFLANNLIRKYRQNSIKIVSIRVDGKFAVVRNRYTWWKNKGSERGVEDAEYKMRLRHVAYEDHIASDEYHRKIKAAVLRAGNRCQICNIKSDFLTAHHRTYDHIGEGCEIDDLIAVCKWCHEEIHKHISIGR